MSPSGLQIRENILLSLIEGSSIDLTVSPALRRLLLHCQDECVVECCQSGAFSINVVSIGRWLDSERVDRSEELMDEISQIFSRMSGGEGVVCFKVRDLESLWSRKEATDFFEEMSEVFREASSARLNDSAS